MTRRKPTPTTALTKRFLEARGYRVANVEKYIAAIRRKVDAYNMLDLLAVRGGADDVTLGIQCCGDNDGRGVAEHCRKLKAADAFEAWTQSDARELLVFGWGRRKGTGRVRITPRILKWHWPDQGWVDVTETFVNMPTEPKGKRGAA